MPSTRLFSVYDGSLILTIAYSAEPHWERMLGSQKPNRSLNICLRKIGNDLLFSPLTLHLYPLRLCRPERSKMRYLLLLIQLQTNYPSLHSHHGRPQPLSKDSYPSATIQLNKIDIDPTSFHNVTTPNNLIPPCFPPKISKTSIKNWTISQLLPESSNR